MITSFAFNAFILAVHGGNTVRQLAPNTHDVEHAMVDKGQQVMLEEEESATSHLFSDWSDDFKDMNQIIMAVVLLVFGLIFTYKGGKWFKQLLFLFGSVFGAIFAHFAMDKMDVDMTDKVHLMVSAGVGVACGFAACMVYKAGLGMVGGLSGLIAGQFLWKFVMVHFPDSFLMEKADLYNVIFIGVMAIIGGLLAFKAMKLTLKGLTSFIGSFCVTSSIAFFMALCVDKDDNANVLIWEEFLRSEQDLEEFESHCGGECIASILIWMTFFVSGAMYQYGCVKRNKKKKDKRNYVKTSQASISMSLNPTTTLGAGYVDIEGVPLEDGI